MISLTRELTMERQTPSKDISTPPADTPLSRKLSSVAGSRRASRNISRSESISQARGGVPAGVGRRRARSYRGSSDGGVVFSAQHKVSVSRQSLSTVVKAYKFDTE